MDKTAPIPWKEWAPAVFCGLVLGTAKWFVEAGETIRKLFEAGRMIGALTIAEVAQPVGAILVVYGLWKYLKSVKQELRAEMKVRAEEFGSRASETMQWLQKEAQRQADNFDQRQKWLAEHRADIVKDIVKDVLEGLKKTK